MEENKKDLCKILDIAPTSSWAEIYTEIGRLKERASTPQKEYIFPNNPMPLVDNNPNKHYHGQIPCYNNPCYWC